MTRTTFLLTVALMCVSGCGGADGDLREMAPRTGRVEPVVAEVRKAPAPDDKGRWQEYLDNKEFDFREEETSIFHTLSKYDGDCQIHMVLNHPRTRSIDFRFVRDGKTVLSVPGEEYVVFRHADNVVYFAHHPFSSGGGAVGAYDLTTGERLWLTPLKAVESGAHLAYHNQVNLRLRDGVVHVLGCEGRGDYEEILDRKTGQRLGYRVFRGLPPVEQYRYHPPRENEQ